MEIILSQGKRDVNRRAGQNPVDGGRKIGDNEKEPLKGVVP